MSQEQPKSSVSTPAKPIVQPIPENLPEEMLPLYDWWKANGMQFLVTLGAVAVVLGGAFAFKHYRAAKIAGANKELLKAASLEELEAVVAKYGSTKAGNATRLRLAKSYYDASKYDDALNVYDACLKNGVQPEFEAIARLGRAHALEGLERYDEALTAYEGFAKASAGHYLLPQAKMGLARIYALQGKKDEAKKLLENLKAEQTGKSASEMAIANLEGVIDRYAPRAARSLFDAAEAASKTPAATPAPAAAAASNAPAPAK